MHFFKIASFRKNINLSNEVMCSLAGQRAAKLPGVKDLMQANCRFFKYSLSNLMTEAIYEVRIAGATESIYRKNLVYQGQFSPVHSMILVSK